MIWRAIAALLRTVAWKNTGNGRYLLVLPAEATHRRLVRYYQRFGFTPVYEVTGGSLADLPHMLVWGGVGTRMDADVHQMLQRWAMAVRNSGMRARSGARREAGSSDVIY